MYLTEETGLLMSSLYVKISALYAGSWQGGGGVRENARSAEAVGFEQGT
jgi:hypothetical protein